MATRLAPRYLSMRVESTACAGPDWISDKEETISRNVEVSVNN